MQIMIMVCMAIVGWILSIFYVQQRHHHKITGKIFLEWKKVIVLLNYIVLAVLLGMLYGVYRVSFVLTIEYAGILYIMLLIGYIDYSEWKIPNNLLFMMFVFGLACISVRICTGELNTSTVLRDCIWGIILGGGTFLFVYFITRGSLGMGDVKLMGVLGFLLGGDVILVCMMITLMLSAITGGLLMLCKKKKMKDFLPLAPFAAAAIVLLFAAGI